MTLSLQTPEDARSGVAAGLQSVDDGCALGALPPSGVCNNRVYAIRV